MAADADPSDPASNRRGGEARALKIALALIVSFMAVELIAGLLASSLALLSDAAHMLSDAGALAISLLAARLAIRPAEGTMTYGLGRAEILSAQANGLTMVVLGVLVVYGAISHLVTPAPTEGPIVLAVALVGIVVNLAAVKVLGGEHVGHDHGAHDHSAHAHDHHHDHGPKRKMSLNVEGSYRHLLTDLFGFVATAIAAVVIILTGWRRADAIASLLIAAVMLHSGIGLVRRAVLVIMEAAPAGLDPEAIGMRMAAEQGVTEVHDLHVWEVTSGFPTLSAHVVVAAGQDCHQVRRKLSRLLAEEFELPHTTLQVEHARAAQAPLQIETMPRN